MKELQRFEKVIQAVTEKIQEEVSTLIGEELLLTLQPGAIISKQEAFDQPLGKQIVAKMDITGEIEGQGGLLISVKDAIRLGGTLIMLPPAELEEVVGDERYEGETEDSYGEIANIIAGAYTKVFEEMFPRNCRFIRKEQVLVVPMKVDCDSAEPVPDQLYYQARMDMQLDGKKLGSMIMLVPAVAFGLAEAPKQDIKETATEETDTVDVPNSGMADGEISAEMTADNGQTTKPEPEKHATNESADNHDELVDQEQPEKGKPLPVPDLLPPADLEKHKKRVDSLLKSCQEKIGEEVGALLGVEVICSDLDNRLINKEDYFFNEATGKQVLARMQVVGESEDESYLCIGLKDAIRIGCILIMLPPNELEISVSDEDFSSDSQDAYGEIANIISGVYTAVFEEQYTKSLRFIKQDIEQVVPLKVDIGSDTPMPDQLYYMSSMKLSIDGTQCGCLQMLFPAGLLQLEQLGQIEEATSTEPEEVPHTIGQPEAPHSLSAADGVADVLIISDSEQDAQLIREVLDSCALSWKQLSFRDTFKDFLPGRFKAVFLVMSSVDEQSFGVAIKVSACCSLPLIAAGREWTRSKVIRAVKYGVTDILLTPAVPGDVEEKIRSNIIQMAA